MLKLQKQQKATAPAATQKPAEIISDSGKKIKDSALDEILDELYFTLLEADVAVPVADVVEPIAFMAIRFAFTVALVAGVIYRAEAPFVVIVGAFKGTFTELNGEAHRNIGHAVL